MSRILKIVDYWYGETIRQQVFEPLVADFESELRDRRSILTRIRWWFAIASTFVVCAPGAAFGSLPLALFADLVIRAAAFGAFAVAMQWVAAQTAHRPIAVPLSFVTTIPFIILPLIWRIRLAELPMCQRRTLACVMALVAAALSYTLSADAWHVRSGFALMPVIIAAIGWRLGDPNYIDHPSFDGRRWFLAFLVINAFNICVFPASLVLRTSFTEFWPNGSIVTMPLGIAMYLSMRSLLKRSYS